MNLHSVGTKVNRLMAFASTSARFVLIGRYSTSRHFSKKSR